MYFLVLSFNLDRLGFSYTPVVRAIPLYLGTNEDMIQTKNNNLLILPIASRNLKLVLFNLQDELISGYRGAITKIQALKKLH